LCEPERGIELIEEGLAIARETHDLLYLFSGGVSLGGCQASVSEIRVARVSPARVSPRAVVEAVKVSGRPNR
jgi:hypothetical protein